MTPRSKSNRRRLQACRTPFLFASFMLSVLAPGVVAQGGAPGAPQPARARGPQPAPLVPFVRESALPEEPRLQSMSPRRAPRPGASEVTVDTAPIIAPEVERRMLEVEHSKVHFAVEQDGDLWVKGRTYKASFGAQGARYVPFLGSHAPRNFPVTFRVDEARVGATRLALDPPRAELQGDRVIIERGGLRAEYVPGLDGLEQLFLLDSRPTGEGDLVVTLAVETELEARVDGTGLAFDGPHGGVSYGEVFVIDSAGRRFTTPATLGSDSLSIRVPRSFLDDASFPVAIDPLIATNTLDSSGQEQRHPDIAWDPVSNIFTVAFHELFSATDFDVKLVRADLSGNVLGSPFYADFTSVNARHPRVAINRYDRRALVVYTTGNDGARRVEGNLIDLDAAPATMARFTISQNAEGLDLARPDVAGDAFDGPDAWFTVVWERIWDANDADIVLRQVIPNGILLPEQLVTNFVGIRDEAPSISTAPPDLGIHNLVWRRDGNQIVGAQYDFGGFVATPPFSMFAYDPSLSLSVPSVSALGPNVPGTPERAYAVVASLYFPLSNESDVLIFTFAKNQFIDSASDAFLEHTDFYDDQLRPTVASSGEGFACAYESAETIGAPHRTVITSFNLANRSLAVCERRVLADLGAGYHYDPRIVSIWESGEVGLGYDYGPFAVVSQDSGDIEYGVYQGFQVSGAQYEFCYGVVNSSGERSFLTISGDADNTSGLHTLHVRDLPVNKLGVFVASVNPSSPGIVPPGSTGRLCVAGPLARFSALVNSGPTGSLSFNLDPTAIPVPGGTVAAVPGDTWYFQLWHRDSGPSGSTSNFSNATAIPFH